MEAASLVVKISAEGAETTKQAIAGVGDAVEGAGRKLISAGDALMGWGAKLTAGVTVPLMAMGGVMLSQFGDFEQAANVLNLHADDAGQSFGDLGAAALKVGADVQLVGITATEAALSMTGLYKQGLTTAEIFGDLGGYMANTADLGGALRASIDLAAASELELAGATVRVIDTIKQFELPFSAATTVVDTLVKVANAGSASVGSLGEGMKVWGPLAHKYGFSVEEAAIALTMFEDRGIRGAEAGTMLRSIFTQITSNAKPTTEALHELGIELYTLGGAGPMKSMPVIFQELGDALADLTPKQQDLMLNALADTRALTGLTIATKEGQAGWTEYVARVKDAVGAHEEGEERTKGFKAAMEQLGGSLQALAITAIEPTAEGTITPLVQGVNDLVSALSELDPAKLDFGVKIAAGLAAIGPGLVVLGGLTKLAGMAAVGLGAIASPIGALVAGAIVLTAAWDPLTKALNTKFDTNLPSIADGLQHLADTAERAAEAIFIAKAAFAADWGAEIEKAGGVELDWEQIKADWAKGFSDIWKSLTDSDYRKQLKDDAYEIGQSYTDAAIQGLTSQAAMETAAAGHAQLVAQNMGDSITTELGAIDWSPAVTGMMAGMESVTVDPLVADGVVQSIKNAIDAAGLDGAALLQQALSPEAMAGAEIDLTGLAAAVNTALADALPAGMEGIDLSGVGEALAGSLGTDLSTALAAADFSSVGLSLATAFEAADMSSVGAGIATSLSASLAAADMSSAGAGIVASLSAGITGAIGSLSAAGAAAAATFAAGVSAGVGAASAAGAALAAAVTSAVGSIDLFSAGASAGSSLAAGLMSQVGAVSAAAAALSNAAKVSTKKELKMESPSKVFMEYGQLAAQGFAMGLAGGRGGSPSVTLNINGASFGQQPGGAGLMRAIDDYLRKTGTLSRVG